MVQADTGIARGHSTDAVLGDILLLKEQNSCTRREALHMGSLWLALTLLLLSALAAFPQATGANQGVISGTVLDEHGQPFKGVQVCTWMRGAPAGSKESRGDCPAATTDEVGQFRIDHVAMGTIGVEAIRPEDGYVAFAGTSVSELVTLTPNQSSATVVLKLGPKAPENVATNFPC